MWILSKLIFSQICWECCVEVRSEHCGYVVWVVTMLYILVFNRKNNQIITHRIILLYSQSYKLSYILLYFSNLAICFLAMQMFVSIFNMYLRWDRYNKSQW